MDNLALAATSDKATVQQLTAANLALTPTVATLTATNKKLVNAAAKKNREQQREHQLEHQKHLRNSTQTDQCLVDTAGLVDIGSAKVTPARPACTKMKAIRTRRRQRTRWGVVRKTRVGIKPDMGG